MVKARGFVLVLGLVLLMLPSTAHAGRFELLSRAGMESETAENRRYDPYHPAGDNNRPAISADGRWVAFASFGRNLVPGQQDTGTLSQVFLHDRQTGTTVLASHSAASASAPGNAASDQPSISADGRWLLYETQADDLVPGQTGSPYKQLFLYDRDTGTNQLVSRSVNGAGNLPSHNHASDSTISADGEWIAFASEANDLVPGLVDPDGIDVFLVERATGQAMVVSRAQGTSTTAANFGSWQPSLSADGRYVAFTSDATDMTPGFTGTLRNVFLFDRVSGAMTLASHASTSASRGAFGINPVISPDGTAVAFYSPAGDLVAGQVDSNGGDDVFLFDRLTGANGLVSRSNASATTTGNKSVAPGVLRLTAGGAYVAFSSHATNAVAGQIDVNDASFSNEDIFLFERATSSLTLVSRSTASATTTASSGSTLSALAADGSFAVFETAATDVVDGQSDANGTTDVFRFDRATGARTLLSGAGGSGQTTGDAGSRYAALGGGSAVAFWSVAGNLIPGDRNSDWDVMVHDLDDGTLAAATPQAPGLPSATPGASSIVTSVSADGRYAVLLSLGLNLVAGQVDRNLGTDVFLVDRVAGTTTLVSRSAASATTTANNPSDSPVISADGAFVTFVSRATDLVPGQVDTNQQQGQPGFDVFLYEQATGTVTLVSHAAGSPTTAGDLSCEVYQSQGNNVPIAPSISADGRYIAYTCNATNLVPGQVDSNATLADVFLYDRVAGETILVSRKYGSAAATAGQGSATPVISDDGRYVAFSSSARDILPQNDNNNAADVFLFDRVADQMLLVSRQTGTADTTADHPSLQPSLTPDGHYVAFISAAGNLVPGQVDVGIDYDVFLFDRVTGTVELISRANGSATNAANAGASEPVVSADGRFVAFLSSSTDLVPGLSQPIGLQVFVHDRELRTMESISRSAGSPGTTGNGLCSRPVLSPDGRYVAFFSFSSNLSADEQQGLFRFDRQSGVLEQIAPTIGRLYIHDSIYGRWLIPLFLGADGTVFISSPYGGLAEDDFNAEDDAFAYVPGPPVTGDFFTLPPCRLLDTRQASQAPALYSGVPRPVSTRGVCGIPATARAVAINVTVLQAQGDGRLTLHPGNLSTPSTSTINFRAGQTLANNAILPLASNGEGTLAITPFVIGGGTVHVLVDVSGWFE